MISLEVFIEFWYAGYKILDKIKPFPDLLYYFVYRFIIILMIACSLTASQENEFTFS